MVRQLAHLRLDLQADATLGEDDRREGETDAELLEEHRHLTKAVDDGDRELATGEEPCRLARDSGQVGLGQGLHQAIALEGAQNAGDGLIA